MDKQADLAHPFLGGKTEVQVEDLNILNKIKGVVYLYGGVQAAPGFALADSKVNIP